MLPKEVVAHWPEVFKDLKIESIPIEYLLSIKVEFRDGKNWEIRVKKNRQKLTNKELEKSIKDLFEHYGNSIKNVDLTDGLRVNFDGGQVVHLRPSGNAPEFRVYAQSQSAADAAELVKTYMARVAAEVL